MYALYYGSQIEWRRGQDIGYPRVVQRPDGKIVAVYYFMDEKTGRERYVGATIWNPPARGKE